MPHLQIKAEQTSWILIADSKGHTIFDRVLKPGETYKVPDASGLSLTTGNGAGITLLLNGKALPKLSNDSSRIMRGIPLSDDSLKNLPSADE